MQVPFLTVLAALLPALATAASLYEMPGADALDKPTVYRDYACKMYSDYSRFRVQINTASCPDKAEFYYELDKDYSGNGECVEIAKVADGAIIMEVPESTRVYLGMRMQSDNDPKRFNTGRMLSLTTATIDTTGRFAPSPAFSQGEKGVHHAVPEACVKSRETARQHISCELPIYNFHFTEEAQVGEYDTRTNSWGNVNQWHCSDRANGQKAADITSSSQVSISKSDDEFWSNKDGATPLFEVTFCAPESEGDPRNWCSG